MLKLKCFITAVLFIFATSFAFANSIGASYNRGFDDQSFGLTGDWEHNVFEVEGTAQISDNIDINFEPAIKANIFGVSGRVYSNNMVKGDSFSNMGRRNDLGLDFIVPINAWNIDVTVGVFGRNGNPFAPATPGQVLVNEGFDADMVDMIDFGELTSPERGLTIKEGSSVNAAVGAEFDVNRFEVEVRGLLEVMGEGPRADQIIVDISTDGKMLDILGLELANKLGLDMAENLGWNIALEVEAQRYDGTIEYEDAVFAGITYDF